MIEQWFSGSASRLASPFGYWVNEEYVEMRMVEPKDETERAGESLYVPSLFFCLSFFVIYGVTGGPVGD